ncbi:hydrolase-like protein [Zalerion maritima]|uniref:Hydrolase-like protein n=1 Tax=Zalerion maritima TaxID=339359 RepID=A0AAD5RUX4_9PEZI|nr:hydrolase-like protein [Zalerion maritima]
MASPLQQPLKLALIQLASGADKSANLSHAREKILEAASAGAKLVVLPECFNSPYGCDYFPSYAEPLGKLPSSPPSEKESPSYHTLSQTAKDANVFLVGGSIPELMSSGNKETYYNTLLFFGPDGKLITYHRKLHLFDIDIPGGITFKESDVLSPGNKVTVAPVEGYGNIMLGICYDVRFPEPAILASRGTSGKGPCFALIYPGAFNLTTGPLHWQLLGRARAVDNQTYVALCSPARDMGATYHAWGHSLVADPMAKILTEADEKEAIVYAEMKPQDIQGARKGIPTGEQRRLKVYPDITQGEIKWEE